MAWGSSRVPFNAGGEFVARKSFTFDGKEFRRGEVFPWSEVNCSPRRLQQLYEAKYLDAAAPKSQAKVGRSGKPGA